MNRPLKFLLVLSVLLIWGCGLAAQTIVPAETVQSPPTIVPSSTLTLTPTTTIAALNTPVVAVTALSSDTPNASQGMGLPGFYMNLQNIRQYFNPNGAPVTTWHNVPIMPQATAGQDFNNGVYSYKAAATLDQATAFYNKFSPNGVTSMMSPATGSSGTGDNAAHSVTFLYSNLIIEITSFDNDTSHVIVAISAQ